MKLNQKFKELVGIICTTSGIKTTPDSILEGVLWTYFQTYLIGYTLQDIQLAFMMNAAGELPQRSEHYQLLDITFFSSVMSQYLEMKMQAHKRVNSLLPAPKEPEIEKDNAYHGLVRYVKEKGEFPDFWAWSDVYDTMDSLLMITETIEQKKELHEMVKHRIINKVELDCITVADGLERSRRFDEIHELAKIECRKILIKKYLIV